MRKASRSPFPFMKFLKENPDPLNRKGKPLETYTMEEVSKHNKLPSVWTVFDKKVYDITLYLDYHPGKDCTKVYQQYHGYLNIDNFLEKFQIGVVKD